MDFIFMLIVNGVVWLIKSIVVGAFLIFLLCAPFLFNNGFLLGFLIYGFIFIFIVGIIIDNFNKGKDSEK